MNVWNEVKFDMCIRKENWLGKYFEHERKKQRRVLVS